MQFINQNRIMSEVGPLIRGISNGNSINLLLQGSAGCGKTTLARKIAKDATNNWSFQIPSRGQINFGPLRDYPINIIDEIHELKVFEPLYPYLDAGQQTYIFCTTEYGQTPDPFLTRCIRLTFDPYDIDDLVEIIRRYSMGRNFTFRSRECYRLIAVAARGSPRLAKQRFDRVKMMLQYYDYNKTPEFVRTILARIGIFDFGYTQEDLRYLKYLEEMQLSSLTNLSRILKIDSNTLQKEVEPYLIEKGCVEITPRGRRFLKWPNVNGNLKSLI